jgi:hypothetical protein
MANYRTQYGYAPDERRLHAIRAGQPQLACRVRTHAHMRTASQEGYRPHTQVATPGLHACQVLSNLALSLFLVFCIPTEASPHHGPPAAVDKIIKEGCWNVVQEARRFRCHEEYLTPTPGGCGAAERCRLAPNMAQLGEAQLLLPGSSYGTFSLPSRCNTVYRGR